MRGSWRERSVTMVLAVGLGLTGGTVAADDADERRDGGATGREAPSVVLSPDRSTGADDADGAGGHADVAAAGEGAARDLTAACPPDRVPASGFDDVAGPHAAAIDCLLWYGVTRGAGDGAYGVQRSVTRQQMARFLYRLIDHNVVVGDVPGRDVDHGFTDVSGDAELTAALNALASDELAEALGLDAPVVRGHGDGTYRPAVPVARAQMASFVARVFEGLLALHDGVITRPGTCAHADADRVPEAHRAAVQTVCGFGIATGRPDGSFAPREPVTRGQMASFLMRTQDLVADEPFHALLPDQGTVIVDLDRCGGRADGSEHAPFCTIQEGADAARAGERVVVVSSDDLYTEDVDLGPDGIEVVGAPVPDADGELLFPGLDGSLAGAADTGQRVLLARLVVLGDGTRAGVDVAGNGTVALASLAVDGATTGIRVTARRAALDAVGVHDTDLGVVLDVGGGDMRGSSLSASADAHVVDRRNTLDLAAILGRDAAGVANEFSPPGRLGEHDGDPAILP